MYGTLFVSVFATLCCSWSTTPLLSRSPVLNSTFTHFCSLGLVINSPILCFKLSATTISAKITPQMRFIVAIAVFVIQTAKVAMSLDGKENGPLEIVSVKSSICDQFIQRCYIAS